MIFKQLPTMISDLNKLGIALKSLDAMKIGTVGVNAGNIDAYRTALKGLSVEQSVFALASKGATEEQIRQILITNQATASEVEAAMAKVGLTTATKALTQAEMVEMATKNGVAKAEAEALLSKIGITATEEGQVVVKKQVTLAMLEQAVASGTLTKAEASQIATMLGLNAVETANIGITNVLTASFTKLWAVITAHPIGAILTAIGAITVGTIAYINKVNKDAEKALVKAHENAEKALEDTKTSLSDDKSELQSINSELEQTKDKIREISSIGAPTLTEQNELDKLSTANAQLEIQKSLLENNVKLKQKAAALDAKKLLGTQVEMKYSHILDYSSITSSTESYTYADHAKYQAHNLENAYNIYMNALEEGNIKRQELAQELIDASAGNTAELTSKLLEIVESFKYDDGTIIEGYEEIYNEYMGMIFNLQSLTNPDTFLEVAKSVTSGTKIDYEKAISNGYALAYEGNFDINSLNQDFIKALTDAGIEESTINYIFKLKEKEYQSLIDKINKKYNPDTVLVPTYLETSDYEVTPEQIKQREVDKLKYEEEKQRLQEINDTLTIYAKENPIEFQLITSYDQGFDLLDKYIEKEKIKFENNTNYVGDYITNAIARIYDEAKIKSENFNNELSISFTDIFNSSDFADAKEKLLDLAKSGELTPETIESTEDYKTLLDKTGLSAEEAKNKILGLLNSQEKLAAASQGIDKLKSAYEEFKDENIGFVTAETLESLPDVFKNLEGFDLFSKIVGDPTQGVEKIQKAFNDLVTEYIRKQGTLTGLINASESEVNSYIANLKQMGITNAEEVVKSVKNSLSENDTLLQAAESEYIDYLKNKDKYDEDYLTNVASKNGQLISALGSGYQSDYDNWCNLLSRKSEAYNKFVSALGASASSAASKMYTYNDTSAYQNAKKILEDSKVNGVINNNNIGFANLNTYLSNSAKYTQQQVNEAKAYIEAYESAQAMSESLNFDLQTLNLDFGGSLNFDGTSKDKSNSSKSSDQTFDWIERKVNNLTKALNNLKDASDDTYSSWANRSTALTKAIDTTRQAIDLQKQAYNRYMQEAESVALPDIYKNLIKNGALDISVITDEDTKEKINDYQEWYDKAQDCLDVQKDLMDSLNELNNKKFDNIQSIFDFDKSKIEHSLTMLNSQIDKLEMKGLFANEGYYNKMLQYTQKEIDSLTNERTQLANVMNSSALSQDSEAWQEMYSTLTQIDEEILKLNNDLIEFNNSIRDLNWEIFEYLEESINRITDETEYLSDLLSNEDLYDDNGNLTKYADATIGLYATAYDTYRQQAKDYYEEVQDLQKQLVNGAGKDVLEQYYKMVDAHQEAVKSANQEKQAILDLISDGYQKQIDYLNEIINKKKDSLNAEKDLYDYQKSIEEKSKNISSLQKQYDIYKNDMSEEGIAQAQKIKVQLETAQQDLEKTEYEQYLRDQEEMLDTLSTDFEDFLNQRLDNEDALLSEIIGTVSGKGDEINSTLNEVADKYGTMISDSITSIFDAKSPFTNTLSNGITTINNSIAGTTSAIDRLIAQVANITNANASKTNAGNGTKGNNSKPSGNSNNGNNTNTSGNIGNNNSNNSTPQNSSNNSVWGSWFIRKTDSYPKNKLDIQNSIVDRLKYNSIDSSFSARSKYYSAMGGSGTYTGSASQNTWMLNQLKSHGYAKGSKRIPYDQIALLGEEGNELQFDISEGVLREVGEGDKIFTNEASKVLWDFSKNPSEFIEKFGLANLTPQFNFVTPTLPPIARNNASNSVNMNVDGIEINLPNVTNYKEFRNELIKDSDFTNAMGTYVNNKIMGKNPLEHLKYVK